MIDKWGRFPTFAAKIGTGPGTVIIVRRDRSFHVGQRIKFAEVSALRGMSTGVTPPWQSGTIWRIDDNRLFISR